MDDAEKKIANLKDLVNVQCSKGNFDQGEYMRGLANGLICALAVMTNVDPKYIEESKNGNPN